MNDEDLVTTIGVIVEDTEDSLVIAHSLLRAEPTLSGVEIEKEYIEGIEVISKYMYNDVYSFH